MRSFKKFLIACGLCVGVGLAFGTSEVKAGIEDVTILNDSVYDPASRQYKLVFKDINSDDDTKMIHACFDGVKVKSIAVDTGQPSQMIEVEEDIILELAAKSRSTDFIYRPSVYLKFEDEPSDSIVAEIPFYSIVVNCEYSEVSKSDKNGRIYPSGVKDVTSGDTFYSLDSGATVSLNASPKDSYTFTRWDISPREKSINPSIDATFFSAGTMYTARSGKITGLNIKKALLSPGETAKVEVQYEGTVSPADFQTSIDPADYATFSQISDEMTATIEAIKPHTSKLKAVLKSQNYLGSREFTEEFSIVDKPVVELSNYILTAGKEINLSLDPKGVASVKPDGATDITWKEKESGKDIKNNIFSSKEDDQYTLIPTVTYGDTSMEGDPVTITVYPYPTLELDKDEYELTVEVPEGAGSGNTSICPIQKYKLHLDKGSTILGYYPDVDGCFVKRKKDGKLTIDNDDLEEFIQDVAKKKQSRFDDKEKIEVNFVIDSLTDSRNETIDIENESEPFSIYKVTVSGDNAETKYYYGLKGQKIKISPSMKSGATFDSWEDGNKDNPRSITISSDTDKNKYKVIATGKASTSTTNTPAVVPTAPTTPGSGTGGNTNLDKVPKTGEGNAILWVLMVSVITIIGAGSAVYYKMKAPKKAEVNYDAQVRDVTFANPEALMQEKLNRRNNDSSRRK